MTQNSSGINQTAPISKRPIKKTAANAQVPRAPSPPPQQLRPVAQQPAQMPAQPQAPAQQAYVPPPTAPAPVQPVPTAQPQYVAPPPMQTPVPTTQPTPTQYPGQYPATAPAQPVYPQMQKPKLQKTKKQKPKKTHPPAAKGKDKAKYFSIRYRTRILKGSILPILYGLLSIQMLRHYVLEFPDYYQYNIMLIVFGFLIGFGTMSGITLSNIIRTKNNPKRESTMNFMVGLAISIPLIVLVIGLALFIGLASAWQFSIGFFLAAIFPALFVILFELTTKNKFFIREAKDEPQKDRKLVAVAA